MDFTNMTMEELNQIKTELSNEIDRRVKAEEQKAIKEFLEAFCKLVDMAVTVTYEDYEEIYTLINPERFHFTSL